MKSRGMPGAWFFGSRKYSKKSGCWDGKRQRDAPELRRGLHAAHRRHHRVVEAGVGLGGQVSLQVGLVQHLPVRDREAVARLVPLAELVGEAPLRVPGQESRVVVRHLLEGRVAELAPLGVVPDRQVGIRGIGDGLLGLDHPLGDGAEVEHDGMALGGLQEVDRHGIDEREIPGRLPVLRGLELGHAQPRVGQPRHVADVVRLEVLEGLEGTVVDGRPPPQGRVHHHLQGGRRPRDARHRVPLHRELRRRVLGGRGTHGDDAEGQRGQRRSEPLPKVHGVLL